MRIVREVDELRSSLAGSVGLVPTMGAFHQGHLSLMERARRENDVVVVSLFVNPTQFGPNEDFDRYPRDENRDGEMAASVGVDILFEPSVETVYPRRTTTVSVAGVTDRWEAAKRPGHFDGVSTVVCKLFNMVRPTSAYFGMKDLQQCAVIKRMVEDLNIGLRLVLCETYREADGLAMSSRNAYLSTELRAIAPGLYQNLSKTAALFREDSGIDVEVELKSRVSELEGLGFAVDYFALVDTDSLEPLDSPPNWGRL